MGAGQADVGAPDLVGVGDRYPAQQVGVILVLRG